MDDETEVPKLLRIKARYFNRRMTARAVAREAQLEPETFYRIINGKQRPGFGAGQSAERIAKALDWTGDVRELFEEVDG